MWVCVGVCAFALPHAPFTKETNQFTEVSVLQKDQLHIMGEWTHLSAFLSNFYQVTIFPI